MPSFSSPTDKPNQKLDFRSLVRLVQFRRFFHGFLFGAKTQTSRSNRAVSSSFSDKPLFLSTLRHKSSLEK